MPRALTDGRCAGRYPQLGSILPFSAVLIIFYYYNKGKVKSELLFNHIRIALTATHIRRCAVRQCASDTLHHRVAKHLALRANKLLDKHIVKVGETVVLAPYKHIAVASAVVVASSLDKPVTVEHILRDIRYPHIGIGIVGQQLELTCTLENEYPTAAVFRQLVLLDLRERQRRDIRIGVRYLDIAEYDISGSLFRRQCLFITST